LEPHIWATIWLAIQVWDALCHTLDSANRIRRLLVDSVHISFFNAYLHTWLWLTSHVPVIGPGISFARIAPFYITQYFHPIKIPKAHLWRWPILMVILIYLFITMGHAVVCIYDTWQWRRANTVGADLFDSGWLVLDDRLICNRALHTVRRYDFIVPT
jgi:hypothetical protein